MNYNYTRSGNAIAKNAKIQGSQFIVNQGMSVIGQETEIHGEKNHGKPIISWGKYVVLDDGSCVSPAEKEARKYIPLRIGNHVYIGSGSEVEATSIGSHVIIGKNCRIGSRAVIHDCTVVSDNSVVPPLSVVGPMTKYVAGDFQELPESAEEAIDWFCEMKYKGIEVSVPF